MKTQEEIRLKRLAAVEGTSKFISTAGLEVFKDTPTGKLLLATHLKIGAISDTLSWVLGESKGKSMDAAINEAENLVRLIRTGQPFPKITKDKALRAIKEAFEEGPELGKKIKKDQDELLKKPWDELESEE